MIVSAFRWVWDFVVGDVAIVTGVAVAVLIGLLIDAGSSRSLHDAEGPLIFAVVLAGLLLSLWQGFRDSRTRA